MLAVLTAASVPVTGPSHGGPGAAAVRAASDDSDAAGGRGHDLMSTLVAAPVPLRWLRPVSSSSLGEVPEACQFFTEKNSVTVNDSHRIFFIGALDL